MKAPSFFWRGVLILLPLALLAALGITSLRQDRLLAEAAAREQGQRLAEQAARQLAAILHNAEGGLAASLTVDKRGRLVSVDGSATRARMAEPAQMLPIEELSVKQQALWQAARAAEFREEPGAAADWEQFLASSPPPVFAAQAQYALGLRRLRENEMASALRALKAAATNQQFTTEAGVPLFVLAQYQLWRATGKGAQELCSNAVSHPSLITPVILEAAGDPQWRELWGREQAGRQFYERWRTQTEQGEAPPGPRWMFWSNEDWLVTLRPREGGALFDLLAEPDHLVTAIARRVLGGDWPRYARADAIVAGKNLRSEQPEGQLLAGAQVDDVSVLEYLTDPGALFADARRRTAWFAALIVVSAGAAAVGLTSAWRGFHEQARLSEMKSNFVSSVSHELRAPIASMRLMAESLERGRISDEAKKKEYFHFLAQESRRLTSLIENILDFSRIEQGRKTYQFEPADIRVLVGQTMESMRPNAREQGVLLESTDLESLPDAFTCDALALQQALVNLIENAIRHSPPGGVVTIGGAGGSSGLELWVEDRGAGIPSEEHEKIFERFYRLGSELRRETQGIGIGLSIVKHIAEAHDGRVHVRSAPGKGSRFTLQLPWKRKQTAES